MTATTVITDEAREVDGTVVGDRVLLEPGSLTHAIGWELQPQGLCRGDVCVPVRDSDRDAMTTDGQVDLVAVASVLGRSVVVDTEAGLVAVAMPAEGRREALHGHQAPGFTLPDLDGTARSFDEWRTDKKLLVAFASW